MPTAVSSTGAKFNYCSNIQL